MIWGSQTIWGVPNELGGSLMSWGGPKQAVGVPNHRSPPSLSDPVSGRLRPAPAWLRSLPAPHDPEPRAPGRGVLPPPRPPPPLPLPPPPGRSPRSFPGAEPAAGPGGGHRPHTTGPWGRRHPRRSPCHPTSCPGQAASAARMVIYFKNSSFFFVFLFYFPVLFRFWYLFIVSCKEPGGDVEDGVEFNSS